MKIDPGWRAWKGEEAVFVGKSLKKYIEFWVDRSSAPLSISCMPPKNPNALILYKLLFYIPISP